MLSGFVWQISAHPNLVLIETAKSKRNIGHTMVQGYQSTEHDGSTGREDQEDGAATRKKKLENMRIKTRKMEPITKDPLLTTRKNCRAIPNLKVTFKQVQNLHHSDESQVQNSSGQDGEDPVP